MFQRIGAAAFNKNLEKTRQLCAALNHPEASFKSVHIAGTNGKGSSAHSIAAILQCAGYKTGLYTSPHLKLFTERIRIDGIEINEESVVNFVNRNGPLLEQLKPSFFETTVAMAFDYFAKEQVDIAVIEVGMGGRLDSTNVITPEVCLITQIGFDHQQYLGETLEEISKEKAGIIKKGVPVVLGELNEKLLPIFRQKAAEENCELIRTSDYQIKKKQTELIKIDVRAPHKTYSDLSIDIRGEYYLQNIPGIIETIYQLKSKGFRINENAIRDGLANVVTLTGLKGRWQVINNSPLIICDVGHNEAGLQSIVDQILKTKHKRLHFVLGTVNDKKLDPILDILPKSATYYFTQAKIPRALDASELSRRAFSFGLNGEVIPDVNEAIQRAMVKALENDLIFIGGSSFVVAEIDGL
ncbi:MAG: bifunctional folylpolyglutamate synthase/dihydrofolate synthase [Bacteroidetes bacterium]|nr:bifunctional folylpolyglutamate synthase/dihydrofolate synthase [Bacteroidota bacterium]